MPQRTQEQASGFFFGGGNPTPVLKEAQKRVAGRKGLEPGKKPRPLKSGTHSLLQKSIKLDKKKVCFVLEYFPFLKQGPRGPGQS